MSKTIKEQFYEALENGITHKAIFLAQFMKNEINEPYDYRSPLFWASRYGNEKVIKALSDMGAVEEVDKEGMGDELLKILWREGIDNETKKRAIELIKDGANLEKKDKFGYTALKCASANGHIEVVKALLDAGADVTITNNDGSTALMDASANGYVEVIKTLISRGAKVDEKDNNGETALMRTSRNGHVEVAKALIDAGAKVDEKNDFGNTALIWASLCGHVEVVKTLISRGAKVDEKDNNSRTALMYASVNDHVEVAKALIDAGADVTIKNNDGVTAIDCISNDEIKKLLNEAMKKQKEKQNEKTFKNKISGLFGR